MMCPAQVPAIARTWEYMLQASRRRGGWQLAPAGWLVGALGGVQHGPVLQYVLGENGGWGLDVRP